jgi:hypothetical protein
MLISAEHVVLKHSFYDQDDELVQELTTLEIVEMGGRTVASRQRMGEVDSPEEWSRYQR